MEKFLTTSDFFSKICKQPKFRIYPLPFFLANPFNSHQSLSDMWTWLQDKISPLAFFNRSTRPKKYQKRDRAWGASGAKMRIRKSWGVGLASVGFARPITWNSPRAWEKEAKLGSFPLPSTKSPYYPSFQQLGWRLLRSISFSPSSSQTTHHFCVRETEGFMVMEKGKKKRERKVTSDVSNHPKWQRMLPLKN